MGITEQETLFKLWTYNLRRLVQIIKVPKWNSQKTKNEKKKIRKLVFLGRFQNKIFSYEEKTINM